MKISTGQREGERSLQCPNLISSCVSLTLGGLAGDYVPSQSEGDRERVRGKARGLGRKEAKETERESWQERRKRALLPRFEISAHNIEASGSPVAKPLWLCLCYSCLIIALTGSWECLIIIIEYIAI